MNTNHLKKFAQDARRKLIEQVGAKLDFVLTTDSVELREKTEQLKQLRLELSGTTKEQLIEKVAYTWFNRLMALRFMDVNDYQPLGIRVITPKDGYTIPELLDEAKRGNIPEELKVNKQKIYDLLDNKIPSTNPQNEAFKELLIAACNHLNTTFPFLFEKINDYTELLLPDDLSSDFSIVKDVRDGMLIEDCMNVEIIGWLYQFYISEKKDEVFASKSKVKKEDIPAATQLFTPRWIVEYMVQNTLGKLWLQNRPKSRLREHMQYFIESASLDAKDYLKINSPEEIKFIDPASGSGHILVYAFDLLTKIYEEEGYNTSEIPQLIIQNNLYGFEIDERAAQLSALALLMKARQYHRRVFNQELNPNILCYYDLLVSKDEIRELFNSQNIKISDKLMHDLMLMQQATNFGSLIMPHADVSEIDQVLEKLTQFFPKADVFQRDKVQIIIVAIEQLSQLALKFHCAVTNPPYMGGNMNSELSAFVKNNYPDSKADLMACFMESGLSMINDKGFLGMINQHSWMFLSSYERLRKKIISDVFIDTLLHLGTRTFPEIGGEVVQNSAFTILKNVLNNKKGIFIRLVNFESSEAKNAKTLEAISQPNTHFQFRVYQKDFEAIPSSLIAYWASDNLRETFKEKQLQEFGSSCIGMRTGDNLQFLRFWFEISGDKLGLKLKSHQEAQEQRKKWIPYCKGGTFRKWYGNNDFVVNWDNNGFEIKENTKKVYPQLGDNLGWKISNEQYYFKAGLTWSGVGANIFGVRYYPIGMIFDSGANSFFVNDENNRYYFAGLLNTTLINTLIEIINPTINTGCGVIAILPAIFEKTIFNSVNSLVENSISISIKDWDRKETSYDFKINELIKFEVQEIDEALTLYKAFWKNKFFQLHKYEEEINRQFIDIYNLHNEISPYVQFNNVTILQEELDYTNLHKLNNRIIRNSITGEVLNYNELSLPFNNIEILEQYISYSVGCIFGRYSLDKDGLILSKQGETLQDYHQKINIPINDSTYFPDADNIIPFLEDEWFEDDIVGRFYQFLKVTFGDKNFNKNLAFIEDQIGKDIRKYLIKDFYPDHIKRYKKRPIYWMFSSPKGSFNVLIYMHRYTPDTVSNILNKYLKEFIGKLNTRKEHLERVKETGSSSDKVKAIKESDKIQKMLVELHEYERDILYPLATERIEIDLDDGVLVNYNKFGKAVKEVNGLNDPATKKKVKQFDWIDTSQIR